MTMMRHRGITTGNWSTGYQRYLDYRPYWVDSEGTNGPAEEEYNYKREDWGYRKCHVSWS